MTVAAYKLMHPLYLDVQMMISFLAYIEGGVSLESESTVKTEGSKERKGAISGKLKFPTLSAILGVEASLNGEASSKAGESAEWKEARHHTFASLFNALYEYLSADAQVRRITETVDTSEILPGQLVEISGRYAGNPLEQILGLFGQWMNYFAEGTQEEQSGTEERARRSGNPNTRAGRQPRQAQPTPEETLALAQKMAEQKEHEFMLRMFSQMLRDIEKSAVHDVLLETPAGIRAVLTVSSEYYSPTVNEYLSAGEFVALGKVTRVLKPGEKINLARRSVVGAAGSQAIEEMVDSVVQNPDLHIEAANPVVTYPAVQILPMAIFI